MGIGNMMRIRCLKCNNNLQIRPESINSSTLYQCPYCSWIIDLTKVNNIGRTILVASGKGGVGKSITSSNLAISLASLGKEVLVIDANFGLANQHILMNVNSPFNLFHFVNGEKSLEEVKVRTNWNVDLIKGSTEIYKVSGFKILEHKMLLDKILSLEMEYDFTIIDMPTGINENSKFYYRIAKEVIILTSANITSISDTFRVINAIKTINNKIKIGIIVNRVKTKKEAEQIFDEIANYCFRFYDVFTHSYGFIFDNQFIDLSVQERIPLFILKPESNVSKCIREIADRIIVNGKPDSIDDFQINEERYESVEKFKNPPSLLLPENSSIERRIAERKNIHQRLLYSYIDTEGSSANHCRGPGISQNISLSGILFKSIDQIPKTKHLLMTFNFNSEQPTRISGQVVHNEKRDEKNRILIGVVFKRFFGQSKNQIEQVIANNP
jgi:flagellar biosynthesis protein FlhG